MFAEFFKFDTPYEFCNFSILFDNAQEWNIYATKWLNIGCLGYNCLVGKCYVDAKTQQIVKGQHKKGGNN